MLLVIKLVAYYITHSVAILTDALEAIVNVFAGFLGLYSLRVSAKPRDTDHPYGHGKIEFISAAIEGVMIAVAGVLIMIEAVKKLIHPVVIEQINTGIILITITAIVNYILGSICLRTGKRNNSLALIASGKHLQSDTYTTIGLLAGLLLIYLTDILWLDSLVAIVFSLLIFYTGYKIIRTSVAGIMDESDNELLQRMAAAWDKGRDKNWVDIHNLRVIKYGNTLHIDCHLTVPWYLNMHEAHAEIDKLEAIVSQEFSHAIELFVHSDGCLPISCPICVKDDCPVRHHSFQKRVAWTLKNIQANEKHDKNTE